MVKTTDDYPDPEARGYSVTVQPNGNPIIGVTYNIRSMNYRAGQENLNQIRVKARDGSVTVMHAYNAEDVTPDAQKMYLNDFIANIWLRDGRTPQQLKTVHVEGISNPATLEALRIAREKLDSNFKGAFSVNSGAPAGSRDQEIFDTLLNTPFGRSVDRINGEYGTGKTIQTIRVADGLGLSFQLG